MCRFQSSTWWITVRPWINVTDTVHNAVVLGVHAAPSAITRAVVKTSLPCHPRSSHSAEFCAGAKFSQDLPLHFFWMLGKEVSTMHVSLPFYAMILSLSVSLLPFTFPSSQGWLPCLNCFGSPFCWKFITTFAIKSIAEVHIDFDNQKSWRIC